MSNIAARTETFGGGDYRWLQSARGTEHPRSGTADYSSFTGSVDYPDGYLPSGLPLGYNDTTGLYTKAPATVTAGGLAGFVAHDTSLVPGEDPVIAVITDATVVAEHVPGNHDLADGRYLCDAA